MLVQVQEFAQSKAVLMLVGNKTDLELPRAVNVEDAEEFAKKNDMLFMETSTIDEANVETAFTNLLEKIHKT